MTVGRKEFWRRKKRHLCRASHNFLEKRASLHLFPRRLGNGGQGLAARAGGKSENPREEGATPTHTHTRQGCSPSLVLRSSSPPMVAIGKHQKGPSQSTVLHYSAQK